MDALIFFYSLLSAPALSAVGAICLAAAAKTPKPEWATSLEKHSGKIALCTLAIFILLSVLCYPRLREINPISKVQDERRKQAELCETLMTGICGKNLAFLENEKAAATENVIWDLNSDSYAGEKRVRLVNFIRTFGEKHVERLATNRAIARDYKKDFLTDHPTKHHDHFDRYFAESKSLTAWVEKELVGVELDHNLASLHTNFVARMKESEEKFRELRGTTL